MSKQILVKPIVTEKTERLIEDHNRYTFVVAKKANKIEIKKAVEKAFGVAVVSVSTAVMPGKPKSRYTRGGVVKGQTSPYKKAVVRLEEGDFIDFLGGYEEE